MGEHRVGISNKLEHPVLAVLAPFFGHFPLLLKKFLRHRFPKKNWPSNVLGRKLFLFFSMRLNMKKFWTLKKLKLGAKVKEFVGLRITIFTLFLSIF
jgi:hypothetical protein